SSTGRFCNRRVWTTVNIRSTNRHPAALWQPKAFFRHSTPKRRMRSTWLFVGSTPSIEANNHNAGYSAKRLAQKVAALESAQEQPCSKTPLEFARNRLQPGLQPRSVQFAAAERPPVGEQAFHGIQTHPANCFSGSSSIDQLLKIAFQVGPADLAQVQWQLVVDRPTVATDDAGDCLAQQGLKAREISPEVNHEKGHRRGRRAPEPAFVPLLFPTGLVRVLHRGLTDRRL